MDIVKICKKHGELTKDKIYKNNSCKQCVYINVKKYKSNNREKVNFWDKNQKIKDRDKVLIRRKLYRLNNPLKIKEIQSKYKEKNKQKHLEKHRISSKKYYILNKGKILLRHKQYRIENQEKNYILAKKWYLKNKEKMKKYHRNYTQKSRNNLGDSYIKYLFIYKSNFIKYIDITSELIEVKRIHLKLKRKLKEITNVNK